MQWCNKGKMGYQSAVGQSLEFQHLYNSLIVKVSNVRRVAVKCIKKWSWASLYQ